MVVIYPFIAWIGVWNDHLVLPDAFKGVEVWMRKMEDQNAEMTLMLTSFDEPLELLLGLIVIAGVAAFGEELLFRGVLQPIFTALSTNHHFGIWFTAALFSAIHLQFFGFFPRLILGAMFGYLFYWSSDLKVPMLAHFVNNGFIVIAMYLNNIGTSDLDLEKEYEPSFLLGGVSLVLSSLILFYLYKLKKKQVVNY